VKGKNLYMRFFAELVLSGDSSVASLPQNDKNEGLRMTQEAKCSLRMTEHFQYGMESDGLAALAAI
jgi:hypothetical protein